MTYRVRIMPRAESDAQAICMWIAEDQAHPANALRWLDGLKEAIESLCEHPRRKAG